MGSVPVQKEIRDGRSWKVNITPGPLATPTPHPTRSSHWLHGQFCSKSPTREAQGFNSERNHVFHLALFYPGSPSFEILVFLSNPKTGWPGNIFCKRKLQELSQFRRLTEVYTYAQICTYIGLDNLERTVGIWGHLHTVDLMLSPFSLASGLPFRHCIGQAKIQTEKQSSEACLALGSSLRQLWPFCLHLIPGLSHPPCLLYTGLHNIS